MVDIGQDFATEVSIRSENGGRRVNNLKYGRHLRVKVATFKLGGLQVSSTSQVQAVTLGAS